MAGKLILSQKVMNAMRSQVNRLAPEEACGLLAGKGNRVEKILRIPNAERSPVRYRMEPRAQWSAFQRIEADALDLLAIYHSHPNGPDHLSPADVSEIMYPVAQIIWFRMNGEWQARGFQVEGGKTNEIFFEFIP
jgi:proteasome lid subunit RPN8/RPN11